ncbi:unnamed protein product [Echinostoma caproni]|uniref:Reverse transcriptase n=1 Tax=Echinostoma caproni TaxID=27848 RepID=A0A183AZJ2_9TREM|nr:unnamed protein product [Echinostoma caproni]
MDFLRHTTTRATTRVFVLGDCNASEIEREMEYAPVGSFGDEQLDVMHGLARIQHVTNPTRWRPGNSPSTLNLVFPKRRNDTGNTAIGAALVKLRQRYGRMNIECLQAAAQTVVWSQANYEVVESWDLIRNNMLTLTNIFAPCVPLGQGPPHSGGPVE